MSASQNDSPMPDGTRIEDTLRVIVARLYKAGHHSELTVKRVRKAAEVELELPDDYLREDAEWKSRSKAIIADEHVSCSHLPRMLASNRSHRETKRTKSQSQVLRNLLRPPSLHRNAKQVLNQRQLSRR